MEIAPLLFDLGSPPTTRQVATCVKAGGADALTDATRRADAASYQEIAAAPRSTACKGMPFKWTLNPYRGCTHGCHYCFARRYQSQFELDADDEFASVIFVKTNFVEVLRRELEQAVMDERATWRSAPPPIRYQPIEGHYKLTRGTLEALLRFRNPVGIVTKGPMIVRDKRRAGGSGRARRRAACTSASRRWTKTRGRAGARHGASAAAAARGARAGRCRH